MKKQIAFWGLVLLCCGSGVALGQCVVHQAYAGQDVKPRSEVAWVWLDSDIAVWDIDGLRPANWPVWGFLPGPPKGRHIRDREACKGWSKFGIDASGVLEVLPGSHLLWVFYNSPGWDSGRLPLQFNVVAGKSYRVKANAKIMSFHPKFTPMIEEFNP
jgi:hypothetical protein